MGKKKTSTPQYTNLLFITDIIGEFLLANVRVCQQDLDYGLGKPLHEPLPDLRVGTLQFGHHTEALSQLGKHVNHRVREEGVFRAGWELLRRRERERERGGDNYEK